jgi:uncharacterized membrane protein HdeD (DUF308 family)
MAFDPAALPVPDARLRQLSKFWWVFAVRGGYAILFSLALEFVGSLLGHLFFDPIMLVFLSLLLGVFVLGNGILAAIAGGFAAEQKLPIRWILFGEALFALAAGLYIGISLRVDPQTLAVFAGIVALGAGVFQTILAIRTRAFSTDVFLMRLAAMMSFTAATAFLLHRRATTQTTARWLALFELFVGIVWLLFAYSLHGQALKRANSSS